MHPKYLKKYIRVIILMMIATAMSLASGTDAYAQNAMKREHQSARRLVSQKKLHQQISYLCDSLCGGRAASEKGGAIAGLWLQREFERIGLKKIGSSYAKAVQLGNGRYGRNIVGLLPGSCEAGKEKYVVVGAHYDHIGTLNGRIYPGADANASGTAALLSVAEMLCFCRDLGKSHDSNVIFVAFDAKEHGMAGSKAFWNMIVNGDLKDPVSGETITKSKIAMMVNIDQIGCTASPLKSGRDDYIIMLGNESLKPSQRGVLNTCNRIFAIDMEHDYTYYGSKNFTQMFYRLSDQRVFIDNGIPSVLFTSGITMNTNKTYDTPETINLEILQKRIFLIYHWLDKML